MKAYLAGEDTRLEIVTGMELEAFVLDFIQRPDYGTYEEILQIMSEYWRLYKKNHN